MDCIMSSVVNNLETAADVHAESCTQNWREWFGMDSHEEYTCPCERHPTG